MSVIQRVRCPNCGDFAARQVLRDRLPAECDYVVQTACEACDYLLIMGFPTGRVLEAYAPGRSSAGLSLRWHSLDRDWLKHQSLSA